MRRQLSARPLAARWISGVFLTSVLLAAGCAGSSDDENDNLDAKGANGNADSGDLGNDDAHEGNGQDTKMEDAGGSKDTATASADVNSDTSSSESLDAAMNGAGSGGGAAGASGSPANAGAPSNAAVAGDSAASAPSGPSALGGPGSGGSKAAPAPTGPTTPIPGGRVRYVKEGGAQAVNGPSGSPVLTLDQGEHPLTWEENGQLKIAAGLYVPADAMSEKGVRRGTNNPTWIPAGGDSGAQNSGGGSAPAPATMPKGAVGQNGAAPGGNNTLKSH